MRQLEVEVGPSSQCCLLVSPTCITQAQSPEMIINQNKLLVIHTLNVSQGVTNEVNDCAYITYKFANYVSCIFSKIKDYKVIVYYYLKTCYKAINARIICHWLQSKEIDSMIHLLWVYSSLVRVRLGQKP